MERKKVELEKIRQKIIAIFILAVMFMVDLAPLSQVRAVTWTYYNGELTEVYEITYDANGGDRAPATQLGVKGHNLQLSAVEPTRSGYKFKGWSDGKISTNSYSYNPGDMIYHIDEDKKLYAVWTKNASTGTNQSGSTVEVPEITTTYYEDYWVNFNGSSGVDDYYIYTNKKTIKLEAQVDGRLEGGGSPNASDCIMKVNGNQVNNNNGHGTYEVTSNGDYYVEIYWPTFGKDGWYTKTWHIDKIDTENPKCISVNTKFPGKTIQEGGETGEYIEITAHDNIGLKSIQLDEHSEIEANGVKEFTTTHFINEPGKYKITIKDVAGNVYVEEKYIDFENTEPKITQAKVEKVNETTNNNEYVAAKSGDKIKITLKADREIRSVGNKLSNYKGIIVTLDGSACGIRQENTTINGNTIIIEMDIDKVLDFVDPGEKTIKIYGITDYYNNYLEEYTIPTKLLIDTTPPEIKKFEITGGEKTSDKKAMFIQTGEELTFNIYTNEKLSKNPTIKIAGETYKVVQTPKTVQVDNEECYLYTISIESKDIINEELNKEMLDGFIPVTIGNLVDEAGNEGKEYTYDNENKTNNDIYLVYGVYSKESLYIVSTKNDSNNTSIGDLNGDGYITEYDAILMTKLLAEYINKEIGENDLKIVDVNYDGQFNDLDLSELRSKIKSVKNRMYGEQVKTFKVYNANGENIKGDDLTWKIYDGSKNDITEDKDRVDVSYDPESGEFSFKLVSSNAVTIKVYRSTDDEKEKEIGTLRLYNGIKAWYGGIKVDRTNNSQYSVKGDLNNDGWVTSYDAFMALKMSVKSVDGWDDEAVIKRGDFDGNGKIDSEDALMILRDSAGLGEGDKFHVISKNDEITFSYADFEGDGAIRDKGLNNIDWEIISLDDSEKAFEVIEKNNNNYKIKAVGENGARALIKATEQKTEHTAFVYVEINDLQINLSTSEIKYDLAEENQEHVTITPYLNIRSNPLKITSENEEIAKINIDTYGNVEVIPGGKTGTTKINFECDGKTETCTVNVVKGVNEIQIEDDITEIEINEGSSKDIGVTINEDATAEIEVGSADTSIAKIYYSKETGKYTIIGVNPGETEVEIYSKTDKTEIKKVIKVKVIEVKAPKINDIKWLQGNFKAGDQIALEFDFDEKFAGNQPPELIISFDNSPSKNNTVFKEFGDDNKSLRYLYTVAEGDNGTLRIDKLVGGNLTDVTGKYEIIKTRDNDYYKGSSTESNGENINYINDGIYKVIDAIKVDTTAPVLRIETAGSKHWLNTGDNIEVKIISTDALAKEPKVSFNGVEAKVEGENTTFTATLKVTDEIKEGYLEITVEDYEDEFGNEGEKLVAKTNNIDEPIIIDKSAPTVEVGIVKTESQDGNYKAGDKVQITLNFVNSGELGTMEYISTTEAPKLNLTFGDKTAQGKLTNNYEPGENSKNYTNKIVYEYEIAEGDKGDLKLQTIVGSVEDVAGNKTDLNIVYDNGGYYILSKDVDEDDELNDQDKQNDSTSGDTTNGSGKTNNQESGDATNGSGKTNNQSSGDTTNGSGKSNNQASGGTINSSDESNNQGAGDTADNSGSSISDWLWSYDDEDLSDDEFDYSYWDEDNYSGNSNSFVNSYADLLPYTGLRIMGYIAILVLLACGDIGVYFFIKKKWY